MIIMVVIQDQGLNSNPVVGVSQVWIQERAW